MVANVLLILLYATCALAAEVTVTEVSSANLASHVRAGLRAKASATSSVAAAQDLMAKAAQSLTSNATGSQSLSATVGIVTWNCGKEGYGDDHSWITQSGVLHKDFIFVTAQETENRGLSISSHKELLSQNAGAGTDRTKSRLFVKNSFLRENIVLPIGAEIQRCPAGLWGGIWWNHHGGKVVQLSFVHVINKKNPTKQLMISFLGTHMTPHEAEFWTRYNSCFQPAWKKAHTLGHAVFMAGDLNFRQRSKTAPGKYDSSADQLRTWGFGHISRNDPKINLEEAPITFPAPYKRLKNAGGGCYTASPSVDCYDDPHSKKHYPSWTDRIIYKRNLGGTVTTESYTSGTWGNRISDHMPVAWTGTVSS